MPQRAVSKYVRSVSPEYQIMRGERVKVSESRTLARKKEIRSRAWRGECGLHSERRGVPRRRRRASKKSLPRGSRRKHERVSGHKSSPGRSAETWSHSRKENLLEMFITNVFTRGILELLRYCWIITQTSIYVIWKRERCYIGLLSVGTQSCASF